MNGDQVRNTTFMPGGGGYDVSEVDDLLGRVAAELDAGRPAGPLIGTATFRTRGGYDVDAVDWFLDQLLLHPGHPERAGISADPWRDLGDVVQLTRSAVSDLAKRYGKRPRRALEMHLAEECAGAWRDFGQLPGTHLQWGRAGRSRYELCTAEQQTIASLRSGWNTTVSAGGRNLTLKSARSSSLGIAEIAARSARDCEGHFAAETKPKDRRGMEQAMEATSMELVDETGIPILYTSGQYVVGRATDCISFTDQRWLRFWVRGTHQMNAIMTAADQAGNRVARYRITRKGLTATPGLVEITVHPDQTLTDELVLAIAISAPWLAAYFWEGGGG